MRNANITAIWIWLDETFQRRFSAFRSYVMPNSPKPMDFIAKINVLFLRKSGYF
jgi:hypothetical protein